MNAQQQQLVQALKDHQVVSGQQAREVAFFVNGERVVKPVSFDGYMLRIDQQYIEPKDVEGVEFEVV